MFGQVRQILEGHINELIKSENDLHDFRMEICKKCKLYSETSYGGICDARKCINVDTNEVTTSYRPTTKCGCGCRLDAKTRVKTAKCVLNKW